MASANKTPNLGLNQWAAADRPKRTDFVADNMIVDEKLGEHLKDTNLHFTAQDRERLEKPFVSVSMSGTGTSVKTVTLPFAASFVIVYKRFDAFQTYESAGGYIKMNGAFFSSADGTDDCGSLKGSTLTLKQSTSAADGIFYNLNEQYGQYVLICFK